MKRTFVAVGIAATVLSGCGAPSSLALDCRTDRAACAALGIAAVGLVVLIVNSDGSTSEYVIPD